MGRSLSDFFGILMTVRGIQMHLKNLNEDLRKELNRKFIKTLLYYILNNRLSFCFVSKYCETFDLKGLHIISIQVPAYNFNAVFSSTSAC